MAVAAVSDGGRTVASGVLSSMLEARIASSVSAKSFFISKLEFGFEEVERPFSGRT